MIRLEVLAIAIGNQNGAFDLPESKAFMLRNPLLLRTYRPEKKCDSEHLRIFTSAMGGLKAGIADILAKVNGKNNRLSLENTLGDLLQIYGFKEERARRSIIIFLQRAVKDSSISSTTKISWLVEPSPVESEISESAS